jgi:nucleotide-binding universal stress UspA family protein
MFKHILLPIDGTPVSEKAISGCVAFAKDTGAKITGLHVTPEFRAYAANQEMLADSRMEYAKDSLKTARQILTSIETAAASAGVPCDVMQLASDHPHQAIIDAARQCGCDLITMATRGYVGIKSVVHGSETHKVLAQCDIPVLVYR